MARPIWNGTISFGLLNVPVQLYSGEKTVDLHLRMLDSRDQSPIRYERINSETGEEVPWKDIVKAFEYSKGSYVVIDEDALRKAHPESTETVEIEAFVERASIDPRYYEKPYYLVPGKKAEKGYVLLREILQKSGRVGIAKVVIRTRQYLAALMPEGSALILNLMRFPQELVEADEFTLPGGSLTKYRITPKEVQMAEALVDSMSTKWNPTDYKDDFRQTLRKIVDAQVAKKRGRKGSAVEEKVKAHPDETTNVVDFMALLKKSLEGKEKRSRGEVKPKRRSTAARSRAG
jgi:DNA end-binding protein Ku